MLVQIPRCVWFICIGKDCSKCFFVCCYVCKKIHWQYKVQVFIFINHNLRCSKNSSTLPAVSNIKIIFSVRSFFPSRETERNWKQWDRSSANGARQPRDRISANARERQTTARWIIQLFISSMSQHRVNLSRHSHVNLIYLIYFSMIPAQCIW